MDGRRPKRGSRSLGERGGTIGIGTRLLRRAGGETVWLAAPAGPDVESDSLLAYRDAVCVPLRRSRAAEPPDATAPETPLLYPAAAPTKRPITSEINVAPIPT